MKMKEKTFIIAGTLMLASLVWLMLKRQHDKKEQMLDNIADEGYETAQDILYPLKPSRTFNIRPSFLK